MTDKRAAFFRRVQQKGMVLTLEPLKNLCGLLGEPQNKLPCVHIAGTNGKGSVLKMVSLCLESAGYKVGCYFSPQVFDDEPSVSVNGRAAGDELLGQVTDEIISAYEQMERLGMETPTLFEIETASALMCFARSGCDICVVECGMGGRDDATNIIDNNAVCVMTSIGLDHMSFLGETEAEIASNKAGIFRKNSAVVTVAQSVEVMSALRSKAQEVGCTLTVCEKPVLLEDNGFEEQSFEYGGKSYTIKLCGEHQLENAAAAVEVMNALRGKGFDISDEAVRNGLSRAVWHGRFECVRKEPIFILDGAHNVPAARALAAAAGKYLAGYKIILLFGILADKQYEQVAGILAPLADRIVTFTPPVPRALDGKTLAEVCGRYAPTVCAKDIASAVKTAFDEAKTIGEKAAVCAAGSLYSLNEIRKALDELVQE